MSSGIRLHFGFMHENTNMRLVDGCMKFCFLLHTRLSIVYSFWHMVAYGKERECIYGWQGASLAAHKSAARNSMTDDHS